jgi:hypothetical protein
MYRPASGPRITKRVYPGLFGASLALLWAVTALGQESPRRVGDRPDAGGPYPRLPGAVTKAPAWIGADAPFDVDRFFAPVPRDRNAAPLYLDAFFEFNSEMTSCFPEGPETVRRRQAADARSMRYGELDRALREDASAVPAEAIDAVIALYDAGFRKLGEAQRRDRCIFETGLGVELLVYNYLQAARQVARVASLRVRRAVERGDFDAAIRDVEMVLRMVRDLQPRGSMIAELVAAAITQVVCLDLVKTIFVDPGLRVEHCDRLLKVLLAHEASAIDGYAEALRAEYVIGHIWLRDIDRTEPQVAAQASPAERARLVRELTDYHRTLLGLAAVPYARRFQTIASLKISEGNGLLSRKVGELVPTVLAFVQAMARMTATLHATECFVVMRRWQLTHRGLPRALAVAAREAGLKAIPTDPYDGKSMRMAVLDGQPVVYAVGKDGRDDGAQKDSRYDMLPGDLIYRMPTVEARR